MLEALVNGLAEADQVKPVPCQYGTYSLDPAVFSLRHTAAQYFELYFSSL
jgi:hypothetical protein